MSAEVEREVFLVAPPHAGWRPFKGPCWLDKGRDFYLARGDISPRARLALPRVLEIRTRIAPWTRVHVCPRLVRKDDGVWRRYLGVSAAGCITLSLSQGGPGLIETTCHELWHEVERYMRSDFLDAIDAEMRPSLWGEVYLDSPWERRARLFDSWCSQILEGFPSRPAAGFIDEIFWYVWSGQFAQEVLQNQNQAA